MDVTINPFVTKAKIKVVGRHTDGGGSATLRIWNAGGREPLGAYRIELEHRDPEADKPKWKTAYGCGIELDCKIGLVLAQTPQGQPTVTEVRSVIYLGSRRLDTSPVERLKTIAGPPYDEVAATLVALCGPAECPTGGAFTGRFRGRGFLDGPQPATVVAPARREGVPVGGTLNATAFPK